MTFFDYLKTFFLVLIILQVAPPLFMGIKKQYGRYLEPHTQVGLISLKGLITDAGPSIKSLQTFFKDNDIKAILLKIDCQGSASGSGESIFNELNALKNEYRKPVVALVENVCASGGYHIACAADYIIAPGMALIGSIGVTLPYLFQLDGFIAQHNVGYVNVKAGKYKSATDPFVAITEEEKAELQKVVDDSYEQFVENVATSRKLSIADAPQWANAKLFSGRQALKLGLIDEIGSVHNAISVLKNKALIEGEITWVRPHEKSSLWRMISGRETEEDDGLYSTLWHSFMTAINTSSVRSAQELAKTFKAPSALL